VVDVEAKPLDQPVVEIGWLSVGLQVPDQAGDRLDNLRKLLLTRLQLFLGLHEIIDIEADPYPLQDFPVRAAQGGGATIGPAVDAVRPALPIERLEGRACA